MTVPVSGSEALVDDEDYGLVSQYEWYLSPGKNTDYAKRMWRDGGHQHRQFMHTLVTGWSQVDHWDGNGLNNQHENLREVTTSQNLRNSGARQVTSAYKGVGWHRDRWRSRIYVDGERLSLGNFRNEEEAARVYDEAARRHFGEFACLNFPREGESAARR